MNAKEPPIANVERQCVDLLLSEGKRLDGRKLLDFRSLDISFAHERGGVYVTLGDTRVFTQVSCDVTKPSVTRPFEGVLQLNLDLTPMASQGFEMDRSGHCTGGELGLEANRIIERCVRDSRCVDLESLCIISGEKVWRIRVDIKVLNHEGNIIDCCCISAITALFHFRRPDVTVTEERVQFHSSREKALIGLNMQHMPVCVTIAFFDQGRIVLLDPTRLEEAVMHGKMAIPVNNHKELCTIHLTGGMLLTKEEIMKLTHRAATVCTSLIIPAIKAALEKDHATREDSSLAAQADAALKAADIRPLPRDGDTGARAQLEHLRITDQKQQPQIGGGGDKKKKVLPPPGFELPAAPDSDEGELSSEDEEVKVII